jgi:hypothetical protein
VAGHKKKTSKKRAGPKAKARAKTVRSPRKKTNADDGALVLTRPQAVRLLNVSDRTFARLEAEGVIFALAPGSGRRSSTYDAYTIVRAYWAHRERQLMDGAESPRDRRDRSQAELNELRVEKERRVLLPRDQVVREGQRFVKAVAAKLRALPSRLVRAGIIAAAVQGAVEELIREALDEMSRWSNRLDLLRAINEEKKEKGKCTAKRRSPTGRAPSRRRRS